MGLFLIKGTFHVVGYQPDGDSIRFHADNFDNWDLLGPGRRQINGRDHMQLRLEGIDALETHFSQGGAESHQPLGLARQARALLLEHLGIKNVQWNATETTVVAADDGVPGYILTRKKDDTGRPISFVFPGTPPETDGTNVFVTVDRMKESGNYRLIEAGHAYPFFFTESGLFTPLRNAMAQAVVAARNAGKELHPLDGTNVGVEITSTSVLTDQVPLFPRLFRRLAEFLEGSPPILDGFPAFLAALNTRVIVISPMSETGFDNLVVVEGQNVRLTERPENLVFIE
jgi:hypothetical protein